MPMSSATITAPAGRDRDERRAGSVLSCCLRQISEAASRLNVASETPLVRPSAALALFVCLSSFAPCEMFCFILSVSGGTPGCGCATVSHPGPSHLQGWTCCTFSLGTSDCFSHWLLPLTSCKEASPPNGLLLRPGWSVFSGHDSDDCTHTYQNAVFILR